MLSWVVRVEDAKLVPMWSGMPSRQGGPKQRQANETENLGNKMGHLAACTRRTQKHNSEKRAVSFSETAHGGKL